MGAATGQVISKGSGETHLSLAHSLVLTGVGCLSSLPDLVLETLDKEAASGWDRPPTTLSPLSALPLTLWGGPL